MKTAILPALAGAMLFLGACSSEEPVKPEASLQKGEPTYTAFSIKMNTPSARAVEDDDNAIEFTEESPLLTTFESTSPPTPSTT